MSQKNTEKRLPLSRVEIAQLAMWLDSVGDCALAEETGLARQTIARAVAGLRLYTEPRRVLQAHLARPSLAA